MRPEHNDLTAEIQAFASHDARIHAGTVALLCEDGAERHAELVARHLVELMECVKRDAAEILEADSYGIAWNFLIAADLRFELKRTKKGVNDIFFDCLETIVDLQPEVPFEDDPASAADDLLESLEEDDDEEENDDEEDEEIAREFGVSPQKVRALRKNYEAWERREEEKQLSAEEWLAAQLERERWMSEDE